ncbi:MAG: hypothetical protein C0482_18950 [Gordonia sp.]|nr:hypothetical protein [Gordonia sp. (in: high G+C Gram-positive bacteria)]
MSSDPRRSTREPRWWVRDVLISGIVAVVISAGTIVGQKLIDDVRADRDHEISRQENARAERLENLRFVRGRSIADPTVERPFYAIDLAGLSLAGLDLPRANLGEAKLNGCDLLQTNLEGANLAYADLTEVVAIGVNLKGADLTGAVLRSVVINNELARSPAPGQPVVLTELTGARAPRADFSRTALFDVSLAGIDLTDATFVDATFIGVDLTGADLTGADFEGVSYDEETVWPAGFTPPPSAE